MKQLLILTVLFFTACSTPTKKDTTIIPTQVKWIGVYTDSTGNKILTGVYVLVTVKHDLDSVKHTYKDISDSIFGVELKKAALDSLGKPLTDSLHNPLYKTYVKKVSRDSVNFDVSKKSIDTLLKRNLK